MCTVKVFPPVKFDRAIPKGADEAACRSRPDNPRAAASIPLQGWHFDNYLWRLDFFAAPFVLGAVVEAVGLADAPCIVFGEGVSGPEFVHFAARTAPDHEETRQAAERGNQQGETAELPVRGGGTAVVAGCPGDMIGIHRNGCSKGQRLRIAVRRPGTSCASGGFAQPAGFSCADGAKAPRGRSNKVRSEQPQILPSEKRRTCRVCVSEPPSRGRRCGQPLLQGRTCSGRLLACNAVQPRHRDMRKTLQCV